MCIPYIEFWFEISSSLEGVVRWILDPRHWHVPLQYPLYKEVYPLLWEGDWGPRKTLRKLSKTKVGQQQLIEAGFKPGQDTRLQVWPNNGRIPPTNTVTTSGGKESEGEAFAYIVTREQFIKWYQVLGFDIKDVIPQELRLSNEGFEAFRSEYSDWVIPLSYFAKIEQQYIENSMTSLSNILPPPIQYLCGAYVGFVRCLIRQTL